MEKENLCGNWMTQAYLKMGTETKAMVVATIR